MDMSLSVKTILHAGPLFGFLLVAGVAVYVSGGKFSVPSAVVRGRFLVLLAAALFAAAAYDLRTRGGGDNLGDYFRATPPKKNQPKPIAPIAAYGGTPLYSPVGSVANLPSYACFDGDTPLSCAAWFCNMSSEVTNAHTTRSCEMTATPVDFVKKVSAIGKATCTQSTNARCTTAALTAIFANYASVFAAYCTDKYYVIATSGKSRTQVYNLDSIPFPPGGTDSVGACRTRSASITDGFSTLRFPLAPVPLDNAALTNNMNTQTWPNGQGDQGWLKNGKGVEFGIPAGGHVGNTITGQELFPVFNNNGGYTPEKCEVDACQMHVGQGGGAPHLHGDPFGPSCLYNAANYSSVTAHPPLIAFSVDGYLIYGRHLSTAAVGASVTLDLCGGHTHDGVTGYHYHTQVLMETSGSTSGASSPRSGIPNDLPYVVTTTGPYCA